MKGAFSFIEVIVSVVILSYLGVAILNFNSFNKNAMYNNIEKQSGLLIATPLLYNDKKMDKNKEYSLNDLVTFKNLSDDDRRFLKNIKLQSNKKIEDKVFLYNDGKKDFFLEYGNIAIKYKDNKPLNFMFVEKP